MATVTGCPSCFGELRWLEGALRCTVCGFIVEPVARLQLPLGATYAVWPRQRYVATLYPDGLSCCGTRDEEDAGNRREALQEGYRDGPRLVWSSLVEHEALHSFVAFWLYTTPSKVLRTEAGEQPSALLALRYEEEATALAFQTWKNTGQVLHPLQHYATRNEWRDTWDRFEIALHRAAGL